MVSLDNGPFGCCILFPESLKVDKRKEGKKYYQRKYFLQVLEMREQLQHDRLQTCLFFFRKKLVVS